MPSAISINRKLMLDMAADTAVDKTGFRNNAEKEEKLSPTSSHLTFEEAVLSEPPKKSNRASIVLGLACLVAFFATCGNGYDSSLFNSLLQNAVFKDYFDIENVGLWTGLVSSLFMIGHICAAPFIGPLNDTLGRRKSLCIGAIIVISATVVQGTVSHRDGAIQQFMAGRFFIGFGAGIANSTGTLYVIELSHPAHRGVTVGLSNTLQVVGSIVAAGTARGSLFLGGQRSWLVPIWVQIVFTSLVLLFAWTLPESPRWLYVNNRKEAAKAIVTKYHGGGNPESPWVVLQMREFEEHLEMNGSDKRWWDYRGLVKTRSARYRIICSLTVGIFGQETGGAVLGYFLSGVLDTAGFRTPLQQMNITLARDCLGFVMALLGALCVDKIGRRPLLLGGNIGCSMVWIGMVAATSRYAASIPAGSKEGTNHTAAIASLVFIFLYSFCHSFGFNPVTALYPAEVLSFEMRAKGIACTSLAVNTAGLINQFIWPVSLKAIQWKTYIVFIIWCLIQAIVVYFVIPETKNRTLEELDDIFSAENPVKKSLEKKKKNEYLPALAETMPLAIP